jgi:hypothetical protein
MDPSIMQYTTSPIQEYSPPMQEYSPPMQEYSPPMQEKSLISLGEHTKVTRAAFYTLIAGLILSIVIAFTFPVSGPLIGIFVLLVWVLLAYNINCVQVGHCYTWAWILTIFYLIYISFAVFALIIYNKKIVTNFGKSLNTSKKSMKLSKK